MRVGNVQHFEQALHAAVFAPLPVQRVEADVGLELGQHVGDIAADVDFGDLIAFFAQRLCAALSGHQTDRTLRRPAAHQHGDMLLRAHHYTTTTPRCFGRVAKPTDVLAGQTQLLESEVAMPMDPEQLRRIGEAIAMQNRIEYEISGPKARTATSPKRVSSCRAATTWRTNSTACEPPSMRCRS